MVCNFLDFYVEVGYYNTQHTIQWDETTMHIIDYFRLEEPRT